MGLQVLRMNGQEVGTITDIWTTGVMTSTCSKVHRVSNFLSQP
ncbi:hypothetical protein [Dictyobacter vulcani]